MKKIRLTLAQINLSVGAFRDNSKKIIENIHAAHAKGAEIIVFPELSVCGYPPEDLLLKPHFLEDNKTFLEKIAAATPKIITFIGLAYKKENSIHNSCAIIYNKKILGFYNKKALPNYAVFDEKRYFREGSENLLIKYKGVFIGVNICEDIWRENVNIAPAQTPANLLINLSASPYYKGKIKMRRGILGKRAKNTKSFVAYCNLVGGQDELVFDGGSLVFSPEGALLLQAPQFKESLSFIDLDLKQNKSAKACGARQINIPESKTPKKPPIKTSPAVLLKEETEVYEALKLGLKDYVRKNHFKKTVLGLSGGIDSALCAVVAADALGKDNVIACIMPSKFTSSATLNDAITLAKTLGIKHPIISIDNLYQAYLKNLKNTFKHLKPDKTEENIQARIRGNILMAMSNKFGYLVLTTGNKSETSVGYCTLYGDMAGGFAVLKDVPKTLVYKLAKYRNSLQKNNVIIPSIIKRAPSAELSLNQKDQDTLPPYGILDKILKLYVEEDKSLQQIIKAGFDKKIARKVITMVDRNEYKRRQAPPGIRITPKAFGKDRRMPITNQYVVK